MIQDIYHRNILDLQTSVTLHENRELDFTDQNLVKSLRSDTN